VTRATSDQNVNDSNVATKVSFRESVDKIVQLPDKTPQEGHGLW